MQDAKEKERSDSLPELVGLIATALEQRHMIANAIKREGKQLVIPDFMTYQEAANTIQDWVDQMEEDEENIISITGHPDDMLMAFDRSIKSTFGQLLGKAELVPTFFGMMKRPSKSRIIKISAHEKVTVPLGNVQVPGLPIKLTVRVDEDEDSVMESKMLIKARYVKKFGPLVTMIEEGIRDELANNSIFLRKAIDSRFEFLDLNGFPLDRIVYADQEAKELNAHIFRVIRSTAEARKSGLPIKRTVLLHGKFGTGKTLTALLAANICTENGWTFMNVRPGDGIVPALTFAKNYQPCLVFFEDIDQETKEERGVFINTILNTVDGILSKSAEVMCILTTNNAERIERAMLRPGRIDAVIEMGRMDVESMTNLIFNYCGTAIDGNVDFTKLLDVAQDYTPSFISEACNRAILFAMERMGGNGVNPVITHADLETALHGLRSQFDLMNTSRVTDKPALDQAMTDMIKNTIRNHVDDLTEPLKAEFERFQKWIRENY